MSVFVPPDHVKGLFAARGQLVAALAALDEEIQALMQVEPKKKRKRPVVDKG